MPDMTKAAHSKRALAAGELFEQGYNCAQSVALAFRDLVPLDEDTLARLASPFGAGIGRMNEVCGAVSGMAMIIGLTGGYSDPKAREEKAALYSAVQKPCREFESICGSIVCRELLGSSEKHRGAVPEERTPEYYKKRPCRELVMTAADILERSLSDDPAALHDEAAV